jgi:hypothetical protein
MEDHPIPAEFGTLISLAVDDMMARLDAMTRREKAENEAARAAQDPCGHLPIYPVAGIVTLRPAGSETVFVPAGTPVEPADGATVAWRTAAPVTIAPVRVAAADHVRHLPGLPDDGGPGVRSVIRLTLERTAPRWGECGPPNDVAVWFGGAGPEVTAALFNAVYFHGGLAFARGTAGRWLPIVTRVGGFDPDEVLFPVADELRHLVEAAVFHAKFHFLKLARLAAAWGDGGVLEVAVTTSAPRSDARPRAAAFRADCVAVANDERAQIAPVEFTAFARDRELDEPHVVRVDAVAEMPPNSTEYGPSRPPGLGRGFGLGVCRPEYTGWYRRRSDGGYRAVLSRAAPDLPGGPPESVLARVDLIRCDGPAAARVPLGAAVLVRSAGGVLHGELIARTPGPVVPAALGGAGPPLGGLTTADQCDHLRTFVRAAGLTPAAARWAAAITGVRIDAPVPTELTLEPGEPAGLVNGRTVTVALDTGDGPDPGVGLFAAALDRCLGLSTTRCEFTRLVVTTAQEEYRCPPRLGSRTDL